MEGDRAPAAPTASADDASADSLAAGLRLLAGFEPALESAFHESRRRATRLLRLIGLGFALLAYPGFLLLDALWTNSLQHDWVYGLCLGVSWPATLVAFLAVYRDWRRPFDAQRLMIAAILVNQLAMCIAQAMGLARGVAMPFEAFLHMVVYVYLLSGVGFRAAAVLSALLVLGYIGFSLAAGMRADRLAH